MGATQLSRVNWWHERIVDWELQNPDSKLGECAAFFNKTQPWLSTVRNSDAFMEYRAQRIAEHQDNLSMSVIDKVEGLAHLTLDTMKERIEAERHTVSLSFLRETTDSALKALGYTSNRVNAGPIVQVVNINAASPEALARAREKLRNGQGSSVEVPALTQRTAERAYADEGVIITDTALPAAS